MSLNIQTSTGLVEVGKVTEEKIISALGYEPANNTHTTDKTIHVTSKDRQTWNNKSDFSGAYTDLIDAPNITETDSGNLVIADQSGFVALQVDESGLKTTTVTAKSVVVDDIDVATKFGSQDDEIAAVDEKVDTHIEDADKIHLQASERDTWNDAVEALEVHMAESDGRTDELHISSAERTFWNNKSEFSGNYSDLNDKPNIVDDESALLQIADNKGFVALQVDESGLKTTTVTAKSVVVDDIDAEAVVADDVSAVALSYQSEGSPIDVKSKFDGVDTAITNIENGTMKVGKSGTADQLATARTISLSGDASGFTSFDGSGDVTISVVIDALDSKANADVINDHIADSNNPHGVTASQVGLGNVNNTSDINKPVSTAQQAALDALEKQLSESIVSEAEEWTIVDSEGYIIATVDSNGLETTQVTANKIVADGVDVGAHIKVDPVSYTPTTTAATVSGYGASGSIKVPKVTVNEYGHVTAIDEQEFKVEMPDEPNLDFITTADIDTICGATTT